MATVSDPGDEKIIEAVKEVVVKETHEAVKEGVEKAKKEVALEEKAKS